MLIKQSIDLHLIKMYCYMCFSVYLFGSSIYRGSIFITFLTNQGVSMKNVVGTLALAAALGLTGCAGSIKYVDIQQGAPIAVIGFSLNKSIVEEGKEPSRGPGLLQKAENYYKNHQEAVNVLWNDFKEQLGDILLGSEIVATETIIANGEYQTLTKHVPKMMLGTDVAPGAKELPADGGLNFVNSGDNALMEKLSAVLSAKMLMTVELSGSYAMSTGVSIAGIGAGAAKMKLTVAVTLYEKEKGIVLQQTFSDESDDIFPMVGGELLSDNYAKGLSSAQKKILPQIKSYFSTQQEKAKAVPAK